MADLIASVFVSHGAPTIALGNSSARAFLAELGKELGRPSAILCVSAHWETDTPMTCAAAAPETIRDFYGFPEALYALRYPAPGAPDIAERAASLLADAGLRGRTTVDWGLDHGAWIPLMLMYPDADVPIVQLSIQHALGTAHHLALGRALAPLRSEGVLVLGSGGAVHNLRYFRPDGDDVPEWARQFDDWLAVAVEDGRVDEVVAYRERSADGAMAHPRDEHFLPLLVAMGAGGPNGRGRVLHRGFMDGALSMAAYAFD